jgi:predicted TIM-barrel fold metal-dependent hydrolase
MANSPDETHRVHALPALARPVPRGPLPKVAVEEHFDVLVTRKKGAHDVDLASVVRAMDYDTTWMARVEDRLADIGERRIAAMDAAGVDISILSHTTPGVQGITDAEDAVAAARDVNDALAAAVAAHPTRLAGFASVALQNPAAAAAELDRCVNRLGFKGVMVNGYTNAGSAARGAYLDEPQFLPFWEAATALGTPVYIHPRPALEQRIYAGHSELIGAAWGFAPETATHALRLVYSGLLDRFPALTIVLGHLGETLPYFAWRIQHCFEYNPSDKRVERRLQDYLCENFYVSTSGFFDDRALISTMQTMGVDRMLFAVDYPYEDMGPACDWIERAPIGEADRRKIAHLNARALFSLDKPSVG